MMTANFGASFCVSSSTSLQFKADYGLLALKNQLELAAKNKAMLSYNLASLILAF